MPRWSLFFRRLLRTPPAKWDQKDFRKAFLVVVGRPFTVGRERYPDRPCGGATEAIQAVVWMHEKWRGAMGCVSQRTETAAPVLGPPLK